MYLIVCIESNVIVNRFGDLAFAKAWVLDNNVLDGEPCKIYTIIHESKYHA